MRKPLVGFLNFLVSLLGLAGFAFSQSSPDVSSMLALKSGLKLDTSKSEVDWSSPDPCKWMYVGCDSSSKRVTRIQVKGQGIYGTLAPDLKNLTSLVTLEFMSNNLSGPIPDLSGLSSLQTLNLHTNLFTSVPKNLFTGMTSLQQVFLDHNPITPWGIPESLKDATGLQQFSATNCNITGRIPDFLNSKNFPSLQQLHLSFNNLQGELPAGFSGSAIQSLWLNSQIGQPKLNGSISLLQNMSSLTTVWLHGNSFSGPIPDLSGLALEDFSVRDNQLTGIVPPSLGELKSLKVVNLTNNLLQGPTPVFGKGVKVDMTAINSFCQSTPGVPCDPRVDILLSIAEPLGYPEKFAENWKGNNPCDDWLGITCVGSNITVINFRNMGLSGTISPSFAKLTSLLTINLAENSLTGVIPVELTTLAQLKTLDVSKNQLYGELPSFKNVKVITDGNPDIGKLGPSSPTGGSPGKSTPSGEPKSSGNGEKKSETVKIVGGVIGGVCALGLVGIGFCLYTGTKKRGGKVQSPHAVVIHPQHSGEHDAVKVSVAPLSVNGGSESYSHASSTPRDIHVVEAGNMVISVQVLRSVTNNFAKENILGRGGFGTVYKGELHDGTKIAVKRMESSVVSDKGLGEFKSEIAVLTKVRHRHLVGLLGYCLDGNERLLVYEYMPEGTLSRYLFHWKEEELKPLEWTRRLSIALDVGRGVEYLHTLAHQSFIHRDLKPSNILLGDDMRAKVSDFGLVRLAPDGKQSIETRLAGTFGYLAPEYAVTGRVTTKVDVFSFGVILMELITGRKALDESQPEDSMHLVTWFRRMQINKNSLNDAVDSTIHLDDETIDSIIKVSELAGHCCAREPYQRPDMGHVVNVLSSLVEQWKPVEADPEDVYGIDYDMPLPQVLKKWQAFEGMSNVDDSMTSSSYYGSRDNTQTSLPLPPFDSFTSENAR